MSDVVKWGLLIAGLVAIVALILTLGFGDLFSYGTEEFTDSLIYIAEFAGDALYTARGFINSFFTPFGREIVSFVIVWLLLKPLFLWLFKIMVGVYHYIFK